TEKKAGIKPAQVHAEHAGHAAAAGEAELAASAQDSSAGYLPVATAVSLTGAALIFAAGAVAQSRRRRQAGQD
ncbi:hypothetical protein, partial [Streptomyces sp. NRRL S-15]|uniref:hypothetical protein n=1 Tax=Streptomyces sp. NRRL S-15 TaxID=1463886 RepID=UPI0004CB76AB